MRDGVCSVRVRVCMRDRMCEGKGVNEGRCVCVMVRVCIRDRVCEGDCSVCEWCIMYVYGRI